MKKVIYEIRYSENGEIFSSRRVFNVKIFDSKICRLTREVNHPLDNYPDQIQYQWEEQIEEIKRQDGLKKSEKPFGGYSIIE